MMVEGQEAIRKLDFSITEAQSMRASHFRTRLLESLNYERTILVVLSTIIFHCGHAAFWVGGLAGLFAALFGLVSGVALVFLLPNPKSTASRLRSAVTAAIGLMTPFLFWQALLNALFALRGPVPLYFVLVNAVDQVWARWLLAALAVIFLLALVWAGRQAAAMTGAVTFNRRWIMPFAVQIVVGFLLVVAFGCVALWRLPEINKAFRLGPSVFGEAGPGVGELSRVSLSQSKIRHHSDP